jgi:hypothetical protein
MGRLNEKYLDVLTKETEYPFHTGRQHKSTEANPLWEYSATENESLRGIHTLHELSLSLESGKNCWYT